MRKLALPLAVFIIGLFVADYFFGLDTLDLFKGFGKFLADLFSPGK